MNPMRPVAKAKLAPIRPVEPPLMCSRFPTWLLAAFLAAVSLALFWPALHGGFVNLDDPECVTENPHLRSGLNWESIKWAFTNTEQHAYWGPFLWLSHLLACQLFGLAPWGHHLFNILLHAANTALVFLVFRRLTGAIWRSFWLAALFSIHPLRVESVVWITERKDVLSAFFGLLTLIFYARFVQVKIQSSKLRSQNYLLSLFFFACGLMSKPMLVTWPFVLLLLDYWPLKRIGNFRFWIADLKPLLFEKIPFFVLAGISSVVTFWVQHQNGDVPSFQVLPLEARVANALISYCRYLGKTFWPTHLAVFYPHPGHWPMVYVLLAALFLGGLTLIIFGARKQHCFLLVGWLWFLGTLVPVIGLAQSGEQAMADRFSYLPSLGVLILVVWGTNELTRRWRYQATVLAVTGCVSIAMCLFLTRLQIGYWRDSETLFRHAAAATKNNFIAYNNLGFDLSNKGRNDEAISQYREAIRSKPDYAEFYYNLGDALIKKGQFDDALIQTQEAIRLNPVYALAYNNLGYALYKKGQLDEAIVKYKEAIRLNPDYAITHINLGNAYYMKGQFDLAIPQYHETLQLKPDDADAHNNLGYALSKQGQLDEAISELQEAIRLKPDFADARNNLARTLELKANTTPANTGKP
jgi:protein O-mannosyl-transferase